MTCMKFKESQNGQIYPEDTFSHGAAQIYLSPIVQLFLITIGPILLKLSTLRVKSQSLRKS